MHSSAAERAPLFPRVQHRVSPSALSTVKCWDFSVCTANTLSKKRARPEFWLPGSLRSVWESRSGGKAQKFSQSTEIWRRDPTADLDFDKLGNFPERAEILHQSSDAPSKATFLPPPPLPHRAAVEAVDASSTLTLRLVLSFFHSNMAVMFVSALSVTLGFNTRSCTDFSEPAGDELESTQDLFHSSWYFCLSVVLSLCELKRSLRELECCARLDYAVVHAAMGAACLGPAAGWTRAEAGPGAPQATPTHLK